MEQGQQARRIQAIDRGSVHRICSGQVVLDLAAAIKELVENSLDAGASSIEVKLKEYGVEAIEVVDNGSGVAPENYQALTLKYHTSKISDFTDLQSLTTFGFRGEALSSLCAIANVSILTRTKDEQAGTRICYDRTGRITSQECVARSTGTTVYVEKLFNSLPVRHKEFTKNIRREYSRALCILQAYALIAKDVRLLCTNQVGKSRTKAFCTQGKGSVKDNIVTIFGAKTVDCLQPLDVYLSDDIRVEGFISKPGSGSGRGSSDRQYFYLNGRPVEMPKVGKLLNELYRSFNSQQYPMAFLDFQLPTAAFDVNVTPDKRKIFLHSEAELLSAFKHALGSFYTPDKYTFKTQGIESAALPSESPVADRVNELVDYETQGEVRPDVAMAADKEPVPDVDEEPKEFLAAKLPAARHLSSFRCETVGTSNRESGSAKKNAMQGSRSSFFSQSKRKGNDISSLSGRPVLKKQSAALLETFTAQRGPLLKKNGTAGGSSRVVRPKNDAEDLEDQEIEAGQVPSLKRPGECLLSEEPILKRWEVRGLEQRHPQEGSGELSTSLQQAPSVYYTAVPRQNAGQVSDEKRNGGDISPLSERPVLKKQSAVLLETFTANLGPLLKNGGTARGSSRVGRPENDAKDIENQEVEAGQVSSLKRPGESLLIEEPALKRCTEPEVKGLEQRHPAEDAQEGPGEFYGSLQQASSVNYIAVPRGQNAGQVSDETEGPAIDYQVTPDSDDNKNQNTASNDQNASGSGVQNSKQYSSEGNGSQNARSSQPTSEKMRESIDVGFDIQRLHGLVQRGLVRYRRSEPTDNRTKRRSFRAATVGTEGTSEAENGNGKPEALAAAVKELERSFNKADFNRMKVLGQFNVGFILAKLDRDIFIIDQHASDEKYNFERLSKSTILNKQPLIRPLPLDLSAAEEVAISTHLETFRRNGFDFVENQDALPGRRLQLSAVPFSKNITFGVPDVQEMVALLLDDSSGSANLVDVRPSRVRAMLASRACRSSIMIGTALSKREMEKVTAGRLSLDHASLQVIFHLADLDSPWNCPHGRPTMRHLVDLDQIKSR